MPKCGQSHAKWKGNTPTCSKFHAKWKVNMPKCGKYHTKWKVNTPTCRKSHAKWKVNMPKCGQIPCKMTNSRPKPLQTLGKFLPAKKSKKNPKPAQKKNPKTISHPLSNQGPLGSHLALCLDRHRIGCFLKLESFLWQRKLLWHSDRARELANRSNPVQN